MSWFRFYSDTIHDRKIRRLALAHRWLWVAILCLAKESPEPGRLLLSTDVPVTAEDLADSASISLNQVTSGLKTLEKQRMVHWEGEVIAVTHWDSRQFVSDNSNERVKRYRQKKRNADETLHERDGNDDETPPESEYRVQSTEPEKDDDANPPISPQDVQSVVDDIEGELQVLMVNPNYKLIRDDYHALLGLIKEGVTVDDIKGGIRDTFERYKPKHSRDKIHTFSYCIGAILDRVSANEAAATRTKITIAATRTRRLVKPESQEANADERYANFFKKYPGVDSNGPRNDTG